MPLLTTAPIPEHSIELFRTEYIDRHDRRHALFLAPSPEVHLKRLLAAGMGNLFCLSRAFRNVEQEGSLHSPEFTMLEYYTVGGDYRDSLDVTRDLLAYIRKHGERSVRRYRRERGRPELPSWWNAEVEGMTVRELFRTLGGVDLDVLIDGYNEAKGEKVRQTVENLGTTVDKGSDFELIFYRVLLEKIEPSLPRDRPYVLWDYPRRIRTLATVGPDPRYAERWELYLNGMEVANCYSEEVSPDVVRAYFQEEDQLLKNCRVPRPVDRGYPAIFETVPPCSGVALGVDRLVAAVLGESTIKPVMFLPMSDRIS